ncbi:hypothetical protein M501DRAFT_1056409 [Patellaria atrata CBS 101060]|uniref:RAVE complex protein Rav1 C-terminal domain-containing protein n=1 Tax=Patellaria atrata CBS 101060 TaxID=1346257 RepID=A0A9P4SDX1_9PEZI|nr:hypothetical protein M501DRAFT_1056409 [Patellaria atrata CBS 101060]
MRAIRPGKPQPKLQAVTVGLWEGRRIIAYVSGNAIVILTGPHDILQTIYLDEHESLDAIQLDELSGGIAVGSGSVTHVYKPYTQGVDLVKWSLQCDLTLEGDARNDRIATLSWGMDDELLVGSSCLTLYSTHNGFEQLWTKPLANPPKYAQFSYDASLIASTGKYDRLMKIWRRLSFGGSEQCFDYAYLPHPQTITGMHWRRPFHREQNIENVLYTICADQKLRIWVSGDPHGLGILELWATIDMLESIQPRHVPLNQQSQRRYAFIVDSRDFTIATTKAIQESSKFDSEQHALTHLIEIANRSPEICVVLDDRGNMSAWGLESVGCKVRKASNIFNVAHVEGLRFYFPLDVLPDEDNTQFYNFCGDNPGDAFTVLAHHFDGRLEWLEGRVDTLFDPSPQKSRLTRKTICTGHSSAIKKIVRTASGRALVSRTNGGEGIVWNQRATLSGKTLARQSTFNTPEHIHRLCVLQEGDFLVFLHHESISLWNTRGPHAIEIARRPYKIQGKSLCLILVPELNENSGQVHLATISSDMKGLAWEVRLPPKLESRRPSTVEEPVSLEEFGQFDLGTGDDLAFVLPVDPAGTASVISGFLDTFARDIAISYTNSGVIDSWTARLNEKDRTLEWLHTSTVPTEVPNPSLASGTSIRKAALVDSEKTTLTIWNMRSAQLEHEEHFEGQGDIQDLDWSSTPDNQSILSVGFPHRVVIYNQLRFDYLDAAPSWAPIREIKTRDLTPHPIGDSVWLGSGNLVIGAGNQMFVQDEHVQIMNDLLPRLPLSSSTIATLNIFTVVSTLNGTLAVFHPQFLAQCILAGKLPLVHQILIRLFKRLKFYTDGDELDGLLGFDAEDISKEPETILYLARKELSSSYADFSDDEEPEVINEEVASSLNQLLVEKDIPQLTNREQFHLADIVECVGTVEMHRRSIDENATRFLLFFRQNILRNKDRSCPSKGISWREITWASHSESQDILTDLVSRHYQGRMLWRHARESGLFMWMTDISALRTQFEIIARNEYTKTDEKNPIDCSLYYLALKKKAVLIGLWRIATWSREQGPTQRLLSNNFQDPRWKTAALKNAYALMGKRRFEYAAAFFLLADHLQDAVSVISNQLQDMQLAIAVARVYEGDDGPVLQKFLEEKVLQNAALEGNRWLATWAFWMLGKRDKAVRALLMPLNTLVNPLDTPRLQSKSFLADDPALVVLYKQLRQKSLQTLKGAMMVSPRTETDFILHTARLYDRMGCDYLALDLVRNWEFLTPPPQPRRSLSSLPMHMRSDSQTFQDQNQTPSMIEGFNFDPRKLLRRRSSLVVADLPSPGLRAVIDGRMEDAEAVIEEDEEHEGETKSKRGENEEKRIPTQFQEPDANSLLDSFGF